MVPITNEFSDTNAKLVRSFGVHEHHLNQQHDYQSMISMSLRMRMYSACHMDDHSLDKDSHAYRNPRNSMYQYKRIVHYKAMWRGQCWERARER